MNRVWPTFLSNFVSYFVAIESIFEIIFFEWDTIEKLGKEIQMLL